MPSRARLANEAWEAMLTAHASLIKQFSAQPIWGELTMREYDVLYTLAKATAPMRLTDLCEHVLLSQPALSRMVDRLVARGLIDRTPNPNDGRGTLLGLSDAGRTLQRQVGLAHGGDVARAMTADLDADELEQLRRLARKLAGDEV